MARTATILNDQSLLDVILQQAGTVEASFGIALANGLSITDELPAGTVLEIPNALPADSDILRYYTANGIRPATAQTSNPGGIPDWQIGTDPVAPDGIGYWFVQEDFEVQ